MSTTRARERIQRARWQLWAVTFAILGSLAMGLVFVASGSESRQRLDVLPQGTLRIALLGLIVAFVLYAIDRERNLRRLADRLTEEQVESAQLSTQLEYLSELQRERDTTSGLLDGAADGIAVVDDNLRLLRFNAAMQDLCGLAPNRVLGGFAPVVLRIFSTDGVPLTGAAHPLAAVLADGNPRAMELLLGQPDGSRTWVSGTFSAVRDPKTSRPILVLAIMRDISAQKETEQMQRDFVSIVSHELRAPLTAIRGFAKTLVVKDDELLPAIRREFLSTVNEQAERLARLVDDLLQVARIDAGRLRLEWTELPLEEALRELLSQFHSRWGSRRVVLDLPYDLPRVRVDRERLEEILINLIDNAIKYSPEAAPVRVWARTRGDEIEVGVEDEGIGIAPEDVAQLFQKFQRIVTPATRDIGGTGLGLYIVKGLVEAHGGTIRVESLPGVGSSFTFTVPRSRVSGALRQELLA
jgi:two-component system phosphate regulon sensor histidine kinase PhoR